MSHIHLATPHTHLATPQWPHTLLLSHNSLIYAALSFIYGLPEEIQYSLEKTRCFCKFSAIYPIVDKVWCKFRNIFIKTFLAHHNRALVLPFTSQGICILEYPIQCFPDGTPNIIICNPSLTKTDHKTSKQGVRKYEQIQAKLFISHKGWFRQKKLWYIT